MKGILYLIPTPIGNLSDVSPRIINTILSCEKIACEDTRNTAKLLSLLNISKPCVACHKFNEISESKVLIEDLNNGKNIGYMSDAGYPCISDPGFLLAQEAIKNNIVITPISGPSAFILALIASGIECDHFFFYGFLPSKSTERIKILNELKTYPITLIFYESPHRIEKSLNDLYSIFGDRKITIARELTKIHEEYIRTTLQKITTNYHEIIGEIVLIIEGNKEKEEKINKKEIEDTLNKLVQNGLTKKDAIKACSIILNLRKNDLYDLI